MQRSPRNDDNKADVFISYSRKDLETADLLFAHFESQRISCWLDRQDIGAGRVWRERIAAGISQCRLMVLVLSPESANSKEVSREVQFALHKNKPVIPFQIADVTEESSLDILIFDRQKISASRPPSAAELERLTKDILALLGVDRSPPQVNVLSPSAGTVLAPGEMLRIEWKIVIPQGSRVERIGLELIQAGRNVRNLPSQGVFLAAGSTILDWPIPLDMPAHGDTVARVTVWDAWGQVVTADSHGSFSIGTKEQLASLQFETLASETLVVEPIQPQNNAEQPLIPQHPVKWLAPTSGTLLFGVTYVFSVELPSDASGSLEMSLVSQSKVIQTIATHPIESLPSAESPKESVRTIREGWTVPTYSADLFSGHYYKLRAELRSVEGETIGRCEREVKLDRAPVIPSPFDTDPFEVTWAAVVMSLGGLAAISVGSQWFRILRQLDYSQTTLIDIGHHLFNGFMAVVLANWLIVLVTSAITTIGVFLGHIIGKDVRFVGSMIVGAAIGASVGLTANIGLFSDGPVRPRPTISIEESRQLLPNLAKPESPIVLGIQGGFPKLDQPSSDSLFRPKAIPGSQDQRMVEQIIQSLKNDDSISKGTGSLHTPLSPTNLFETSEQFRRSMEQHRQEADRLRKEVDAENQRTWSSVPVKGTWKSLGWGAILGIVFGLLEFAGFKLER
jgi:hypothetical protein